MADSDDLASRLSDVLREHEQDRDRPSARYERGPELGRGGVAIVYRAYDRKLRREVALKVLHSHLETASEAQERFEREWRAAARLTHPNIVTVHDAGEDGGRMFLVMELVVGQPFSRMLAARRAELRPMLELLEKVARAVHYAHEQGVVHRDLKPANILVSESGDPKVADFGLARILTHESALSTAGAAVGTPAYMAPEQVSAGEITPRTDVYALGAILYEIATGRPPFGGATVTEVFGCILHEDPIPPRKLNSGLPLDVEIIALKALEKEPGRRYESALAFAEDLRRHLDHRTILAQPPSLLTIFTKRLRRRPALSALVGVLLLVSIAAIATFVVSHARHVRAVDSKRAEARRAEREGRLSDAADLYSRLRELEPGDVEAAQKSIELRGLALTEDRRRRAREMVDAARRLNDELPGLQRDLDAALAEIARLDREIPYWREEKKPLWDVERRADDLRRRMQALRASALDDLTTAYYLAPDLAGAAYLEECWRRMTEAEAVEDGESAAYWAERIRSVRNPQWIERLEAGGTFELEGFRLFRYEEGEDRRLVPKAVSWTTPLPRGSYVAVRGETRYPVLIGRGTRHVAKVNLYPEIEGFVYIPGGTFIMGGDPSAYLSGAPVEVHVDDFFIARYEVTLGEYVAFLNDLIAEKGGAEAQKRVPRSAPSAGFAWEIRGTSTAVPEGMKPRWPVQGISWHDATAYCEWLSRKTGIAYRLPTHVEWEKAARGVDGRRFPWGNKFDWTFTKGGSSREGKPEIEEIGAFPKDESPYGVRDLAGSLREWCDATTDGHAHVRGGAYPQAGITSFHVASRLWIPADNAHLFNGFRLARSPK